MNARILLTATKIAKPTLEIAQLASEAKVGVRTIYRHLEATPIPLWMWNAITAWYEKNGPLTPAPADQTFRWYMGKAYKAATPKNPFADAVKVGRPKNQKIEDEDDDEDDDDPTGGGKWTDTKNPDKPESETDAKKTPDTKTLSAALSLKENATGTTFSGSKDNVVKEPISNTDLSLKLTDLDPNSSESLIPSSRRWFRKRRKRERR